MKTTWMSNIMKGHRVGSAPSPIKKCGCSTAKFTEEGLGKLKKANIGGEFGKIVDEASVTKFKGANSSNSSCWKGCKKVGEKESDTRPGVMVNDCDCSGKK